MKKNDIFWMKRCLHLAKRGIGFVSPNPLVGSVIVKDGRKISEGYHRRFGGKHAEIEAIQAAENKGRELQGATLYVNLEPCFHFGKTPPCVDVIIKQKFSRVVVSTLDPNPLVAGKSIAKLKKHGITTTVGVLKKDAQLLNEKFFKFIQTETPFVAIKAAQTSDGFIASEDKKKKWITNLASRKYVHLLRSHYDAILVGANTVIKDNPRLTVRSVNGKNPIRIIVDGRFSTSIDSKIFNSDSATILYTVKSSSIEKKSKINTLRHRGITVIETSQSAGRIPILFILKDLAKRNIASVFVEGGQEIYDQFVRAKNVDKFYLFTAKKKFSSGIKTFKQNSVSFKKRKITTKEFGTDKFEEFSITF